MRSATANVKELVAALGGAAIVARLCGVTGQAVAGWSTAGIPARHWLRLWRMAKERGLDWRPPGAEGLDLVIVPDTGGNDADPPTFTQCSHTAPITEAAA
jgi:hypothetical protein